MQPSTSSSSLPSSPSWSSSQSLTPGLAPSPKIHRSSSPSTPRDIRRGPRHPRATSPTFSDSDSASVCSAGSSPTTPVYATSSRPVSPRDALRPAGAGSKRVTDTVRYGRRGSGVSIASSTCSSKSQGPHGSTPRTIKPSTSSGSLSSIHHTWASSPASTSTSTLTSGSGSHPFLVDQTPFMSRRVSATSLRSTASASSVHPGSSSASPPWVAGSRAARSVDRFDNMSGAGHQGSFGLAADHMLAVDEQSLPLRADTPLARSVSPLANLPEAGISTTSLGSTLSASEQHSTGSWPFHRRHRGSPLPSAQNVDFQPPVPPSHPPPSFHAPSEASLARKSSSGGLSIRRARTHSQLRDSSASSVSASSATSSSFAPIPIPPTPYETGSSSANIDRRCLTWMREAEQHDYYFGSVQSRGGNGLSLSPEERGWKREPLVVAPLEVLHEEKKSCNVLKRFASRS